MLNFLLLLFLLASWPPTASSTVSPLYSTPCTSQASSGAAAQNSTYRSNLQALGDKLAAAAAANGFAIDSFGSAPNDKVSGLALCRGDFAGADCADGLRAAFHDVADRLCLNTTVYYDQYMLSFATGDDRAFSDPANNSPEWFANNMNQVKATGGAAARLMAKAMDLMNRTAEIASSSTANGGGRYATGETWFGEQGVGIVYGLVQCTPDLTAAQCRSCLDGIIAKMPANFSTPAGTFVGGRILGVRCNLRYEKDLFFQETDATLKFDMPKKGLSTTLKIVIFGVPCLVLIISVVLLRPYIVKEIRELLLHRDLVILEREIVSESDERFSLFKFSKIRDATDNFSKENKLGEGGFGPVYKGHLTSTNQYIAVKRLAPNSAQGFKEFKNEIKLIACLRHKNLVRLLGCCIKSKERILVYEYMPNRSLDELIFGEEKKPSWPVRRHIIEGIAEGILYIHDYARQPIVHRDLKPSNILLDHEMNPKISDFGIARIFLSNVTESNTTTAMGTFGYIAPEYYSQNDYSTRSDVFSFGILVLEIISGKRAVGSYKLYGRSYELRRYAWQLWREARCDELVDPSLGEDYQEMDLIRCIQVALLCVQDSAEDRPTMHEVTTMLSNRNRRLLAPAQPGSFNIDIGDTEESSEDI
uniref:Protein kinase domain-containing protein n=1 Tax=Leersia perrieri TaxID=77586 RepID=A0A0D9V0J0_9ORYZ